ncbi:MAG: YggS family pyridoxal phosphate-dependent enzyme [Clostridiales bacterium]|jgi:pyridoxal phosphate enzyme (YggS family)|nr:YggS family pyridoxal phosphate-dependent enzyme [Clostridiales bacterium]
MTIADNIRRVREMISSAAVKSGRNPDDIILIAAAKMKSAESVREAVAGGVDAIGENRVQEMLEKNKRGAYANTKLHYIGHLQSNKVRQIVGLCDMIQSVDSPDLLALIGKRAANLGIRQDVLIEVNIGREPNKAGVLKEKLPEILEQAANFPSVFIRGLMAVPPMIEKPGKYFDEMYNLFVDIRAKKYDNISMNFLSMGMSDSFIEAIDAGANMVRVGSAIFGERQY